MASTSFRRVEAGPPDGLSPLPEAGIGVGFWDWDLASNALILSQGWKRQFGYADAEVPDRYGDWRELVHHEDREAVTDRIRAYLTNPAAAPYEAEFRLRHKDGRYRWVLSRGEAVRDAAGTPVRMVGCLVDLTDRKEDERRMRAAYQRYSDLVHSVNGIVWEANAQTLCFTYVSEMAETILGYPRARWVDEPTFWQNHIHADDRDCALRFCAESTARGESHQFEYRMLAADGRAVWLRDMVTVVSEGGTPTFLRGLMIDITLQKAAEEVARWHQSRLQLSTDIAGLGAWEIDLETNLITVDDEVYRLLGTTAAEQGGYTAPLELYRHKFIPADDLAATADEESMARAAASADYTRQLEHRLRRVDGSIGYVSTRFAIVKNAAGETIKSYGIMQDNTERKLAEKRLKRLLQGESLLSGLSQRFIEMDLAELGKGIHEALQAATEFAGLARAVMFVYSSDGANVLSTHEWSADPADSLRASDREIRVGHYPHLRRELQARRVVRIESMADLPPGSAERQRAEASKFRSLLLCPLSSRARVIGVAAFYGPVGEERAFDADVQSFLTSFSAALANVFSRKMSEDQRVFLEQQLIQSHKMEAIGTLAGGIAHDFNNILGAIVGNLGLARIEVEGGHPVDDSLTEIERAAERAAALVRQILTFSRQQAHDRRVIALGPIVEEAIRLLRASIPSTASMEFSHGHDVPHVVADPTQMHQILLNLGANAWHALEETPGAITVTLEAVTLDDAPGDGVGGLPAGRYACLAVRDNGLGMDEETLKRLFDPFFTTKTVGRGTGLGMSVVHGIVSSHHGAIRVASSVGLGTTVRVYLPAATGAADATADEPPPIRGRGEHVLLIDDDEAIVRVLSRTLERLGYVVTPLSASGQAVDVFRRDPDAYDLVITDYEMPGINGLAVAREILAMRPGLPVVLVSGRFRDEVREEAMTVGIRRIITKPWTTSAISRLLREALADARR